MTTLSLIVQDNASEGSELSSSGIIQGSLNGFSTELCSNKADTINTSMLRFATGVTIPQGATITAASLTLHNNTGSQIDNNVYCENVDNSAVLTTTASSISARTKTTAFVLWSVTSSSTVTSPDLTTPVQAVINRAGWVSGNALNFILPDLATGSTSGYSALNHNQTTTNCAQASITYTGGGGGSPPAKQPLILNKPALRRAANW